MRPQDFQAIDGGRTLRIAWEVGGEGRIAAELLWAERPSAQARRRRLDDGSARPPSDLVIRRVTPIGNYAINIAFSDGHDRGVYPWALLAALAQRPNAEDSMRPKAEDFM